MNALRILHVDDEPDIRELIGMSLALDPDVVLKSCGSGGEALIVAPEWKPDIILMDVMMPAMDGPQTLGRLKSQPLTAGIPVVFMTARVQGGEVAELMALGATGVIPKPFNPIKLAGMVRTYVADAAA
jgi:CheY-like chemotaxis protein